MAAVFQPDEQRVGAGKTGFAEDQFDVGGLLDARLPSLAKTFYDVTLALANAFHVDADVAGMNAVISASPCQISDARAGDHGLGGGASHVDAGAAEISALDKSGAHAGPGQRRAKRLTGLPGADYDGVELLRSGHNRARNNVSQKRRNRFVVDGGRVRKDLSLRAPAFGARNLLFHRTRKKRIPPFARDDNSRHKSPALCVRLTCALRSTRLQNRVTMSSPKPMASRSSGMATSRSGRFKALTNPTRA